MAEVHLIREDDRELRFAHRPAWGLLIALLGGVVAWAAWEKGKDETAQWIGALAGGSFFLIGLGAAFWRYELTLDLLSRTYTRRKGFWPSPSHDQGSFRDIENISLQIEYRRTSSKSNQTSAVWIVGLKLRSDEKPIRLAEEMNEEKGYQRFESIAKKLQVNAVDCTVSPPKTIAWDRLDQSVASSAEGRDQLRARSLSIAPLPHGSRIEFTDIPGERAIVLPALGINSGTVILTLFGLLFMALAAFFLYAKIIGVPIKESRQGLGWLVTIVFFVAGAGISALGIFAGAARDVIREECGAITFAFRVFGREMLAKRIEKLEIEEIAIKESASQSGGSTIASGRITLRKRTGGVARMEVVVRSDRHIARLGGDLTGEEREWLRDSLHDLATR